MNDSETKKIIFLLPIFGGGGGERVVSELSLHLPDMIQSVIVAFESKNLYPYRGRLISLGIPLSKYFFSKVWIFALGFIRLKKIIKREKPDYIMSFGNMQNILNIFLRQNPIIRVDNCISESHKGWRGAIYRLFVRMLFPRVANIIVVSKGVEYDLRQNFNIPEEKLRLIYNPIHIKKIKQLSRESLEEKQKEIFQNPVIINVGNFVEQKGQWHLIRAFAAVHRIIPDARLILIGEGELEQRLRDLARDLGIQDYIYFLGWQENPFKFMTRANVFVLSSLWEGLGIVILEALACSTPVISFDCKSGPREILAPGTDIKHQTESIEYGRYGILSPVGDRIFREASESLTKAEDMLHEALLEVMTNRELADHLKEHAQERAESFDIEKVIKEYTLLLT